MIVTLIKIEKRPSKYGGFFYYCFMKADGGKTYYTYVYPKMRNYSNWKPYMKKGIKLKNLRVKKGRLLDADSPIKEVI